MLTLLGCAEDVERPLEPANIEPPALGDHVISDETRELEVSLALPHRQSVRIENRGSETATFSMKLNDSGYRDVFEIVAAIQGMPEAFAGEPDYRKAWRFLRENRYHYRPLSARGWLAMPLIMVNSSGFGFCHNSTGALARLWQLLGYDVRTWTLRGHVVGELFAEERWQMFDADLEVYYLDELGRVAGVEELAARPELIVDPVAPVSADDFPYSQVIADIYSSTDNNVNHGFRPATEITPDTSVVRFTVPARATLDLARPFARELRTSLHYGAASVPSYSNARLTIPRGWSGRIATPLLIQSIAGRGTIIFGGEEFEIGSDELNHLLDTRYNFDYQIEVLSISEPLVVTYLVNPLVYSLAHENRVSLRGRHLSGLAAIALDE